MISIQSEESVPAEIRTEHLPEGLLETNVTSHTDSLNFVNLYLKVKNWNFTSHS
jgi:hypothetical protein